METTDREAAIRERSEQISPDHIIVYTKHGIVSICFYDSPEEVLEFVMIHGGKEHTEWIVCDKRHTKRYATRLARIFSNRVGGKSWTQNFAGGSVIKGSSQVIGAINFGHTFCHNFTIDAKDFKITQML